MSTLKMLEYSDFNPRSREGSDCSLSYALIHVGHFNPRSREGSDRHILYHTFWIYTFQSTLPRGERPSFFFGRGHAKQFQSTLPRGERRDVLGSYNFIFHYFNPRSREGSDQKDTSHILLNTDFNPRSREGSDNIFDLIDLCADLFQSTLPRGERRVSAKSKKRAVDISIHAPARGATLSCCLCIFCQCNFNPRSREGSDRLYKNNRY